MSVTAQAVKELRERTGLPMMECKKALTENEGNVDKAVEALRKSGAKAVSKLAGRDAKDGKIATRLADDGRTGSMVTLRCETEPVTRNEHFLAFLEALADKVQAEAPKDLEALKALPHGEGTVADGLTDLVNRIRENFSIGRFARFEADAVVSYVHFDGKKGAMVALDGKPLSEGLEAFGRDVCMHIVFNRPTHMRGSDVPADEVDKEREILLAASKADPANAKKPEEILKKIIEGQMQKRFFAERCLLEQPFIKDDKLTVEQACKAQGVTLKQFVYVSTDM